MFARVVVGLIALLCLPVPSWAQAAPALEAGDAELAERLRQGVEAYDRGDLTAARVAFEQVHARAPTARTLRSLGLVAFREQRYEDAVAMLEASLASQVKPLTETQRQAATVALQEARAKLPDPIEHAAVAASAPVVMEAPVAALAAVAPTLSVPAPAPVVAKPVALDRRATRSVRLNRAGYALLGVAGVALVASITSYQLGRARLQKIEADCREGCELGYVQEREQKAHLDALANASLATGIVAGAAGASGTAILLWHWRSDQNRASGAELSLGWRGVF